MVRAWGTHNRYSRLEHVQIVNGGKVRVGGSTICRAGIGHVHSDGEPIDIVNTIIAGSATTGLDATGITLGEFHGNIFAANQEYGVRLGSKNLGKVDAGSDYLGTSLEAPNGLPYVFLAGTMSEDSPDASVGELNAPFFVGEDLSSRSSPYSQTYVIINNKLTIGPGAHFVFGKSGGLTVSGEVVVAGSSQAPAVFEGATRTRGSWDGIRVRPGGHLDMNHATVSWAGGGSLTAGSIEFSRSSPGSTGSVANTLVEGSEGCAIYIGSASSVVVDTATVRYSGNDDDLCDRR